MLPKVQKKFNREVNGKKYYKYLIPVSNKEIEDIGWDENTQVRTKVQGKKLIVEKE